MSSQPKKNQKPITKLKTWKTSVHSCTQCQIKSTNSASIIVSMNQPTNQSFQCTSNINQSTNQPIDQPINQPINQSTNQSIITHAMVSSATKHFRSENKKQIKKDLQTSWWRIIASKMSGRRPFHDKIHSEFTIIPFMMQLFHSWCKVTREYKNEKQRKKSIKYESMTSNQMRFGDQFNWNRLIISISMFSTKSWKSQIYSTKAFIKQLNFIQDKQKQSEQKFSFHPDFVRWCAV